MGGNLEWDRCRAVDGGPHGYGVEVKGDGQARDPVLPQDNGLDGNSRHVLRAHWRDMDMQVRQQEEVAPTAPEDPLNNSHIAELLAIAGDDAKPPLNRAYRRASTKALLCEQEAACLLKTAAH